MISLEGQQ